MLDSKFNSVTLPNQGAWIVTRYTNIFQDKPHLDYLHSLTSQICIVSDLSIVHPTIQAHYPNTLTIWDQECDLPTQCQVALLDGVEVARWTQTQSLKAFAQSSTARRQFQKRWGIEGMQIIQGYSDATIWNRLSPLALLPREYRILSTVQWFELIPNSKLENFVIDNGIQVC